MFFYRGQAAMRADMKETEQSKAAVSVICIGQAVVDCITRGVEGDPLGMGKTRAQSITLNLGGDAVNESFVLSPQLGDERRFAAAGIYTGSGIRALLRGERSQNSVLCKLVPGSAGSAGSCLQSGAGGT